MKMEAAIFFDSFLPYALRGAQEYAGEAGFVDDLDDLIAQIDSMDAGTRVYVPRHAR